MKYIVMSKRKCGTCKTLGMPVKDRPGWFICPCGRRWKETNGTPNV